MIRKRNRSAALATTASVALLAGLSPAYAGPCTTTTESPAYADCTLPSSSAPGAGSFPGSFLVPGTSTSFALHGILWFQAVHDFGPSSGDGGLYNTTALQGPGASQQQLGAHALNGNTSLTVQPTRPNIETRTPTAYGELKTYVEMDFSLSTSGTSTVYGGAGGAIIGGTISSQVTGNTDGVRLRQAYGTLGPWLLGQTKTLIDDTQVYPDIADAGLDAGMRTSTRVHKPQIRYTYLAGNGLTIAADVEMPTQNDVAALVTTSAASTVGALLSLQEDNNGLLGQTGIVSIPDVGMAIQWDQPWGHLKLAGMYHDSKISNVGTGTLEASTNGGVVNQQVGGPGQTNPYTPGQNGWRQENAGYYIGLSGHVNTWGKDRLTGTVAYDSGFADGVNGVADYIVGPGGIRAAQKSWNFDASYEHFWTSQWRSNISGGYQHFGGGNVSQVTYPQNGASAGATAFEVNIPHQAWTGHVNAIFSPVPQTDFITEYQHGQYTTYAGDKTREDRVIEQFKFYF